MNARERNIIAQCVVGILILAVVAEVLDFMGAALFFKRALIIVGAAIVVIGVASWIVASIMLPIYVSQMKNAVKDMAGWAEGFGAMLTTMKQIEEQTRRQGDLLDEFLKKIHVE